jgi:glycosyltransferase involved in cell wall biosynthesis
MLSRCLPRRIICPSRASLTWHAGIGYERDKFVVIPNGFDVGAFHPDEEARRSVREELGISPGALLVGLIARVDRQKDHRTFLRAAASVHASMDNVHFLLCGSGASWENRELTRWIGDTGLRQRLHLLGERQDISRVTAALDVASLSSTGEAFGNVIAEAMACGVPCACTDVGDLSELVGDTGRVAPPEDVGALANALNSLLALSGEERLRMGLAARARVEERYSVQEMVARYQGVYLEVVSQS